MSAMSSCKRQNDDSENEEDNIGEWSPGDGVCPSIPQFNSYFNNSYQIWSKAAVPNPSVSDSASIHIKPFLDLLDNVPSFFHEPPEDLLIGRGHECLSLRSSFQLQTVDDLETNCVERWKSIDYFQDLGVRSPTIYKITTEALPCERLPSLNLDFGYLSSITLGWSYIISARWVEILKRAGWNCSMLQSPEAQTINSFWNMIIQGHWAAKCHWACKSKAKEKIFYSPWMLSERPKKHIKCADWTEGPLDSTMAFNVLLEFCISKNLEFEFITGFASVLMVTSQDGIPPPQLAPPTPITHRPKPSGTPEKHPVFHKILETLDKSMFLSSTTDALDSLLCSAFFNPSVPCNSLGASSSGVKRAFHASNPSSSSDDIDFRKLSSSIVNQAPHLTPLWNAVICTRQASSFINRALNVLPPICLPAAFWTDTIQSFLQLEYRSNTSDTSDIPRAKEFQISYFCRPASSVPWSPAPPFGLTMIKNLSLEIREHLEHDHRPRFWRIDWNSMSDERIPASPQYKVNLHASTMDQVDTKTPCPESQWVDMKTADYHSFDATSRLFNWHSRRDDGLWLEERNMSIDYVRRIHLHSWIKDNFNDGDEPIKGNPRPEVDHEAISKWRCEIREADSAME